MKKLLTLLFLAILCGRASAQTDSTIYLTIPDASILQSITQNNDGTVTPVFTVQGINNIIANYTFKVFTQAFPNSRLQSSRMIYKAIANSTTVASDLYDGYPGFIVHYEIYKPPVGIGYYPNDYSSPTHSCSGCIAEDYDWYLDYINAPAAWDISNGGTHGDSSVVIGINDNWFDVTNPDFAYKIARVGPNVYPDTSDHEPNHGTIVAGLAAGGTDNNIGYPSIGFNCMLDLYSGLSSGSMYNLSLLYGRKIISGSWAYTGSGSGTPTLDLAGYFDEQGTYNEIYENGTIACFAAGNGTGSGNPPNYYMYPASLDHNISVTSVGGENAPGTATFNVQDVHNINLGDSVHCYQHNTRVDICAPGIRVGGLDFSPTDTSLHYSHDGGWGTSFSTPQVAGTLGLMLSENPCLSPYQLEYALKEGSHDIYSVPDNAYLAGPTRWTGRIGAGALDAAGSIIGNTSFAGINPSRGGLDCNDPATQTFFIDGIELNDICAPGHASDSVKPKFSVILENGTPPYTYKWEQYIGVNNTTLDDYTSGTPTIVTSYGSNLAYYRLTVYDNSEIQKVANRDIEIQLTTANAYDLAMRDSYVDMLDEPNSQGIVDARELLNIFSSPDLWNRWVDDGSTTPQEGQYFSGGEPNYMYVRVRNVGCADYNASNSAVVKEYWTLGSTGENWPGDWTTTEVAAASGTVIPGGMEITAGAPVAIPTLHPGDSYVTSIPWYPVEPELYAGAPSLVGVCFLARIEEPLKPTLGMAFTEIWHTGTNVRNNNNIVTRNTGVINLGRARGITVTTRVYVGNTESTAQTYSFQMSRDRDTYLHFAGNLSEYMYVTATLSDGLFQAWASGGYLGNYASKNVQTHTVTYDPSTPMQLDGVTLQAGDKFYADLTFALRDTSIPITVPVNHQKIYFRQLSYDSSNKASVYGNFTYIINIAADSNSNTSQRHAAPKAAATVAATGYKVYPNPAADVLYVSFSGDKETTVDIKIMDIAGRVIIKQDAVTIQDGNAASINFANVEPGIYLVNLQDTKGNKQTYKITKTQ